MEQTTAKLLDGSHQQHGFLSLTYTKAVTKNVRHKLISRNERRSFHKLSESFTDGSPHFLHEILLSAQAFDIVLCFPLLNAIASIFQAKLPKTQKEKRKSPGQPMRTHTLTSRNLPLIYINTSVIRIFVPKTEEMQPCIEGIVFRNSFDLIFRNFLLETLVVMCSLLCFRKSKHVIVILQLNLYELCQNTVYVFDY